jgi:hypothetical protein
LRYERKYRIEGLPAAWVIQAVRQHPSSFRLLFPDRQINNIYFDTPDLSGFNQNVAGVPQRRKHRLRWYGTLNEQLRQPTFEIKIKDGEMGYKEAQRLDNCAWQQLLAVFKTIPQLQYLPLRPVLVNSYQRSYWGTSDGRFRITIDQSLQFAPFSWQTPARNFHSLPDNAIVMELKYEGEDDDAAQRIMEFLPFRQTKNSKYTTGINLVMGGD